MCEFSTNRAVLSGFLVCKQLPGYLLADDSPLLANKRVVAVVLQHAISLVSLSFSLLFSPLSLSAFHPTFLLLRSFFLPLLCCVCLSILLSLPPFFKRTGNYFFSVAVSGGSSCHILSVVDAIKVCGSCCLSESLRCFLVTVCISQRLHMWK